ncbi:unnamed protein product [Lepeophtheirus salmonis]|uniref:(salmon louse) hypothetical protein n=1 Tax=Lepeophtheirus salmonis TaxID=72036 RepID=A0A7R8CDK1_LEPSM|nr:unnamed protein product [Lepeophtheirus salmonis]CAF2780615.1 unnamed protein product [Lepeophtheirus salmonis]
MSSSSSSSIIEIDALNESFFKFILSFYSSLSVSFIHQCVTHRHCGGCNLSFVHVLHYALHIKSLHDPRYSLTIRKYHCKICAIGILGKENFVSHLSNLHRGQGGHQCQYCKKIFPSTVVSGNAS